MFTPDGAVRITDFGIAHAAGPAPLAATGAVMATPGYLAPERVVGTHASAGERPVCPGHRDLRMPVRGAAHQVRAPVTK